MAYSKKKIVFILPAILLILLILEGGLRLTGKYRTFSENSNGAFWFEWGTQRPTPLYTYPPGQNFTMDTREGLWDYQVNSLGYRERPLDKISKDDSTEIRLFILGDSFAEGNGAVYDSTWPRHIERLLMNEHPGAQVYVCGISGNDPFYAYAALKLQLLAFRPTHIIATVNDSDFNEFIFRGGFSRFRGNGRVVYQDPPEFLPLYRYSHLARMWIHEVRGYDVYLIRKSQRTKELPVIADSLMNGLRMIGQLCDENNLDFLAVIHPAPHNFCYPHNPAWTILREMEAKGLPVVNLYDGLETALTGGQCFDYCWRVDNHYNQRGYELMGRLIFDQIGMQYPGFWNMDGRQ